MIVVEDFGCFRESDCVILFVLASLLGTPFKDEHGASRDNLTFQPAQPDAPIARELEQKGTLVAAVRDVPELAGQKMAVGAGHGLLLRATLLPLITRL